MEFMDCFDVSLIVDKYHIHSHVLKYRLFLFYVDTFCMILLINLGDIMQLFQSIACFNGPVNILFCVALHSMLL